MSYKVGINFFPTALAFFKQLPLHKPLGLFTLVAISSCFQLSHAQVSPLFPEDIYADERARFLILEKSLRTLPKRRLEDLDAEIYGLANYPLYPYLLRLRLERTMSLKTQREVEQFLEDYAGQPPLETANIRLAVANTGTEALSAYLAETIEPSQKAAIEEQLEALAMIG